jgi:hypothetical protein
MLEAWRAPSPPVDIDVHLLAQQIDYATPFTSFIKVN